MRAVIPQLGHYCSIHRHSCTYNHAHGCTCTPVLMCVTKIAEQTFTVVEQVGTSTAMHMDVQAQWKHGCTNNMVHTDLLE